jgi:hypothetical protein
MCQQFSVGQFSVGDLKPKRTQASLKNLLSPVWIKQTCRICYLGSGPRSRQKSSMKVSARFVTSVSITRLSIGEIPENATPQMRVASYLLSIWS